MKLSPAEVCFQVFDGPRETARILGMTHQSVAKWTAGDGRRPSRRLGKVPVHHFRALMLEAERRGKVLTLEDLVFGREPVIEGIVVVKDGRKVEVKMRDKFDYMTATLTMAGG